MRALTRVATHENEEELLELARVMTAAQLERAVRAYRRVTTEEARELQAEAELAVFWAADGSLELHGRLAPEDGALLLRALEAMRDTRWQQERSSAEPQPARQASNAEALVAVAEAAVAAPGVARPAGERYQVIVHVDENVLAHDRQGGCELEDGSALAPETARRLACDASLLRNAHKTRTIPPALRRPLRARDSGCRFPAARTAASSTPTTSTTGPKAARPHSQTPSCSAAPTTGSSTKAATTPTPTDASATAPKHGCRPRRGCRAAIPTSSPSATASPDPRRHVRARYRRAHELADAVEALLEIAT